MTRIRSFSTLSGARRAASLLILSAAVGLFAPVASAQTVPSGVASPQSVRHTQYGPKRAPKRAAMYYDAVWGIEGLTVRSTESGELIRFSYHVLNAAKAKQLNDKRLEPFLADPRARVKLVIPSLEKVGQLRQSSTPETGKEYWMAFSNPRRSVKAGDHVSIVIGTFHADNLVVQ